MSQIRELRAKLKKLNGLQWTKKQVLKKVIASQAGAQRRLHRNASKQVPGHEGANYVPEMAVKLFYRLNRTISELTKDLNQRKREITQLESEVQQIKMMVGKDAYLQTPGDDRIFGVHAIGFNDPETGEFIQEEIWGNTYIKDSDGVLRMKGGSSRIFGYFDEIVKDMLKEGDVKVEGKLK